MYCIKKGGSWLERSFPPKKERKGGCEHPHLGKRGWTAREGLVDPADGYGDREVSTYKTVNRRPALQGRAGSAFGLAQVRHYNTANNIKRMNTIQGINLTQSLFHDILELE